MAPVAARPGGRAPAVFRAVTSSVHAAHAVDRDLLDQQVFFDDLVIRGRFDDVFVLHGPERSWLMLRSPPAGRRPVAWSTPWMQTCFRSSPSNAITSPSPGAAATR